MYLNKYVRYYSRLSNLPFGELYYPRSNREKLIHLQILDKIPYDMVESWHERNDILMKSKLNFMPEQFAKVSMKYSNNNTVDYLLLSLLRLCIQTKNVSKSDNTHETISTINECINDIIDKIKENFELLNSAECGIIIRCLTKLEYNDQQLYSRLIYKITERGQIFSIYASLSALNYVVNCNENEHNCKLFNNIASLIFQNLDKLDLNSIAILTNLLSKSNYNVQHYLNQIVKIILDIVEIDKVNNKTHGLDKCHWNENSLHMILNGLSRKNILNKKIFDNLEPYVKKYSVEYSIDTIVSLCNAFSKFGNVNESNYLDLYNKLADQIIIRKERLNNRHICVIANAFAKVFICHERLFSILDDVLLLQINSFSPRQLSMIIHAFAKVHYNSRNNTILWDKCIQSINSFCWQSLTMLFQAYTKGSYINDNISDLFCKQFHKLFIMSDINHSENDFQSITLVSLVYSLVKSNILYNTELLIYIAKACARVIREFKGDEISNLVYSFSKIYVKYNNCNQPNDCISQLVEESYNMLLNISKYIDEVKLHLSPFSMFKIIQSFGESRFVPSASTVVNMVVRNILILDKFSYSHIVIMINSLSSIGIHNHDVLTMLNNIKYNKKNFRSLQ